MEFAEEAILSLANAPALRFLTKIDHFSAEKPHRFESGRGLRSDLKIVDVPVCHDVKRSEAETSVLFELIAHRYESGSLLITSNHPFSAWDSIFADDMMAVAAIDRLIHHADIIELTGESYRKKVQTNKRKER